MVLDLQDALYIATLLFALLTAVFGILVLNTLFRNKLKELFSDKKFFIFFLLATGYALFALGELTWYLILTVFEQTPSAGMPDFYWVTGALFMLVSFVALSKTLYRSYGQPSKILPLIIIGPLLVIAVLLYVSTAISESVESGGVFLAYFYPLMTSLILIFSTNLLIYFKHLDRFEVNLVYLFFANIGFLGGDLLYTYWGASGLLGILSNVFYFF